MVSLYYLFNVDLKKCSHPIRYFRYSMKMVGSTYMTILRAKKIKMKNIFLTVVTVNLNLGVYHQN